MFSFLASRSFSDLADNRQFNFSWKDKVRGKYCNKLTLNNLPVNTTYQKKFLEEILEGVLYQNSINVHSHLYYEEQVNI